MTDPFGRTPEGIFVRIRQRLDSLEERLANVLPRRLQPGGRQVADWNYATEAGFYWGISAAHGPTLDAGGLWTTGWVIVHDALHITQYVGDVGGATDKTDLWKRSSADGGATWTATWFRVSSSEIPMPQTNTFTVKYSTATTTPAVVGTMAIPASPRRTFWVITVAASMGFNAGAGNQRLSLSSNAGTFSASAMNGRDYMAPAGGWVPFSQAHRLILNAGQAATLTITGQAGIATGDNYVSADITAVPTPIP